MQKEKGDGDEKEDCCCFYSVSVSSVCAEAGSFDTCRAKSMRVTDGNIDKMLELDLISSPTYQLDILVHSVIYLLIKVKVNR